MCGGTVLRFLEWERTGRARAEGKSGRHWCSKRRGARPWQSAQSRAALRVRTEGAGGRAGLYFLAAEEIFNIIRTDRKYKDTQVWCRLVRTPPSSFYPLRPARWTLAKGPAVINGRRSAAPWLPSLPMPRRGWETDGDGYTTIAFAVMERQRDREKAGARKAEAPLTRRRCPHAASSRSTAGSSTTSSTTAASSSPASTPSRCRCLAASVPMSLSGYRPRVSEPRR